ncbi:MAG: sigma-70 family RNA polymerase sigma factor [Pirellulaceae bacterium]
MSTIRDDRRSQDQQLDGLIEAARAGSQEALGELLQRCRRYLLLVAGQELAQPLQVKEAPSDLVQDVYVDAQANFAQFHGHTQHELLTWLRGILRHRLARTQRRYQQTHKRDMACEVNGNRVYQDDIQLRPVRPVLSPSSQAIVREREACMLRALESLSSDYRQVILLHHRDGMPFAEIARRMGRSEAAVRKLWARAVQQLRRRLESDDASR